MQRDTSECLGGAQEWVRGSGVTYSLAPNAVLLVIEFQGAASHGVDVRVIQRSVQAVISLAVDLEVDVFEAEGLGLGFGVLGVEVLTRSEKPEETDDDEVGEVAFLGTTHGVPHS